MSYSAYNGLNGQVLITYKGDSYDRYLIRLNEMKQSSSLILDKLQILSITAAINLQVKKC